MSRAQSRAGLVALGVTLASALIAVTCSTFREPNVAPTVPGSAAASALAPSPPPTTSTGSAAPPLQPIIKSSLDLALSASASASAAPKAPPPRALYPEMGRFYDALHALEAKQRSEHVRIAWLGDSHGAADLWSGALRDALQKRFGDGGPGFIHIGNRGYRHDHIQFSVQGKWKMRPSTPSTVSTTGDGVFGLSGILMEGDGDGPQASITIKDPLLPSTLAWDFCFKPSSPKDKVTLQLTGFAPPGGTKTMTVSASASEPLGFPRHVLMTSQGAEPTLNVTPSSGRPGICGVVVETDPKTQPGVVLDTLGINGARLATSLAWNEDAWVAELRRRAPQLVILEYGTNESGDYKITPSIYVTHLTRVMTRVHRASPECDCLVLAPTDRAATRERTPLVRDALKAAAKVVGCAFWDTYEIMGGEGSILKWRTENPPRAAPDGVHLNTRGYRELGERLSADVLRAY